MAPPTKIVSLVDLLETSAEKFGPRELFGTKSGSQWVYSTYSQIKKLVDDFRGGLASLGVGPATKSQSSPTTGSNGRSPRTRPTASARRSSRCTSRSSTKDWDFILRDSSIKVLFVSGPAVFEKTKEFVNTIPRSSTSSS